MMCVKELIKYNSTQTLIITKFYSTKKNRRRLENSIPSDDLPEPCQGQLLQQASKTKLVYQPPNHT